MGKILALDVGGKRVGYALSDEGQTIAFPRGFLARKKDLELIWQIKKIVKEENARKIVIGLPLSEDNLETSASKAIRKFGEKLAREIMLPIDYIDETFSTAEALEKMPFRKDRRTKGEDDAIAAQVILGRYLDEKKKNTALVSSTSHKLP